MQYLHLRDPLAISGRSLLVPQPLIPLLNYMDGSNDARDLRMLMARREGINLGRSQVYQFIDSMDEACYLENEHYRQTRQSILEDFRKLDCRPAANAGHAYPESQQELKTALDAYATPGMLTGPSLSGKQPRLRGILSPHIDYERGGAVYARVWAEAARSARSVEQVIILGTDHYSEESAFSFTRLDYSTPFGRLPTHRGLVDAAAAIIGERRAFEGELHHRSEHSIELALVWLQYVLGDRPVSLLPILCGSLTEFEDPDGRLENNRTLNALVALLARAVAERPTWVVAAGDLSHVGPAFGGLPVTPSGLNQVQESDHQVIQIMRDGNTEGFYAHIRRTNDATNICGVTPIYMAMRILGQTTGALHAYAACPADNENSSFVTVSGLTWV